jgi:hypothetical protein
MLDKRRGQRGLCNRHRAVLGASSLNVMAKIPSGCGTHNNGWDIMRSRNGSMAAKGQSGGVRYFSPPRAHQQGPLPMLRAHDLACIAEMRETRARLLWRIDEAASIAPATVRKRLPYPLNAPSHCEMHAPALLSMAFKNCASYQLSSSSRL